MPRHIAHQPEGDEQRRDEKQKRPRREDHGLDEFPVEDGLRGDRQRQEKRRFAITEKIGVADNQIAQQQQRKQKCEQGVKQAFRQHRAEAGKFGDELQSVIKQLKRQHEITDHERADDAGEQAGLFAHGEQPPPTVDGVHAQQQEQWRSFELVGEAGHAPEIKRQTRRKQWQKAWLLTAARSVQAES